MSSFRKDIIEQLTQRLKNDPSGASAASFLDGFESLSDSDRDDLWRKAEKRAYPETILRYPSWERRRLGSAYREIWHKRVTRYV